MGRRFNGAYSVRAGRRGAQSTRAAPALDAVTCAACGQIVLPEQRLPDPRRYWPDACPRCGAALPLNDRGEGEPRVPPTDPDPTKVSE